MRTAGFTACGSTAFRGIQRPQAHLLRHSRDPTPQDLEGPHTLPLGLRCVLGLALGRLRCLSQ